MTGTGTTDERRAMPRREGRARARGPGAEPAVPRALRIGGLAALAGVSADALRYYERRGLLRPTGRRASGYREYPADAVGLVRFIKRAQGLGFSLAEVDELVRLRGASDSAAAALDAREVAVAKIRDIDERVRQLGALREALAGLVAACEHTCGADGASPACPIIAALDDSGSPPASRPRAGPFTTSAR